MTDEIRDSILKVKATVRTNMFDLHAVQRIAYEMELYSLVLWLEDHRAEYVRFIMYGDDAE